MSNFSNFNILGTKVLDYLYISSIFEADDYDYISSNNIKYIINLTPYTYKTYDNITYLNLPMGDDNDQILYDSLDKSIVFINKYKKSGNILVHCRAGVSRSSSCIIAYLMYNYDISYDKAYKYLKTKRYIIQPNNNFVK
jgi:protein-tyrosine phosphatase